MKKSKMEKKEKILELLSRDNLTSEEAKLLNKLIDENTEFEKYRSLTESLQSLPGKTHLDTELLSEYVLYKNNMPIEDSAIIKLVPQIEKHLSSCSKCMNEFEELKEEYSETEEFVAAQFTEKETEMAKPIVEKKESFIDFILSYFSSSGVRYSLAAALSVMLLYVAAFGVSEITTPGYIKIARIENFNQTEYTRGRNTPAFLKGQAALNNNDVDSAIKYFEEDLKNDGNNHTDFYTNYILGMIYLKKSESTVLGLFPSYDENELSKAIENFESVIAKNKSGMFENITNNAYFFLGKSYLLKNDLPRSEKYLKLVIENKGSRSDEARELLDQLKGQS